MKFSKFYKACFISFRATRQAVVQETKRMTVIHGPSSQLMKIKLMAGKSKIQLALDSL